MARIRQLAVAIGYTFAAWLFAALLIYATSARLQRPWSVAGRCAGLLVTFGPVFSLYFRGSRPLSPTAAAITAVALIALLDLRLVAPHLMRPGELFLSFWDWQLPALLVAATVYLAGRRAPAPEPALK
jgi:hypothetical protein